MPKKKKTAQPTYKHTIINDMHIGIDREGDVYFLNDEDAIPGEEGSELEIVADQLDGLVKLSVMLVELGKSASRVESSTYTNGHIISFIEDSGELVLPENDQPGSLYVGCQLITAADLHKVHAISVAMRKQNKGRK